MVSALAITKVNGVWYFVDYYLNECRCVSNPHIRIKIPYMPKILTQAHEKYWKTINNALVKATRKML